MKIKHLIFGLICFAFMGVACEPVDPSPSPAPEPTPQPTPEMGTYYVMGNGRDDASGVWMNGKNWLAKYEKNKLVEGQITFSNVPAGEWLFKVTDGTQKGQFGFKSVDAAASTPKYTEGEKDRIVFLTIEPSNITIAVKDKKIVLTSTVPFVLQDEYEKRWPEYLDIPEAGQFTKVQKAEFVMGEDGVSSSSPAHKVSFSKSFYLGTLEVTQAQYQAIMGNNPSEIQGDSLPVNTVSQDDANKFIQKLNEKTGRSFRLPTEAEWEFAAMGGDLSLGYTYAGSDNVEEVAWYMANSDDDLQAGGQKMANELGLHDMNGNVAEWCNNKSDNYTADSQVDPGEDGDPAAIRGGAFDSTADQVRNKARNASAGSKAFYNVGIRLLLEAPLVNELLPE